jgi:hypothetical protein
MLSMPRRRGHEGDPAAVVLEAWIAKITIGGGWGAHTFDAIAA